MSGGQVVQYRFTPTCVGKMDRPPGGLRRAGRFTPTCVGKIVAFPSGLVRLCGSPPRAWGKSVHALLYPFLQRFTPTCVGRIFSSIPGYIPLVRFTPTCVGRILKLQKINPLPSPGSHADRKDASIPIRVLNIVEPSCPE